MSKRMMVLLAVLAVVALLVLTDSAPDAAADVSGDTLVAAAAPRRAPRAPVPATMPPVPDPVDDDAPIVDLFAATAGAAPAPDTDGAGAQTDTADGENAGSPKLVLLGFRDADGVREAYLMHNEDMVIARPGAVFGQRYRVLALKQESVRLQDKQTGAAIDVGFEQKQ